MMGVKRLLAGAGAAALLAGAGLVGIASPAQAAPSITVTPNSGLKGGDTVTVSYSGYSPNAPIAVGVCAPRPVKGPGDCGRSKDGASKLTTADASGSGTAEIVIPEGPLGNLTPPSVSCPPCELGATNIASGGAETAKVELNYAGGGGGGNSGGEPKAAASNANANANAGAPNQNLAQTGPRETLIMALTGFLLLQLGLVFAVRASRSVPRRTAV